MDRRKLRPKPGVSDTAWYHHKLSPNDRLPRADTVFKFPFKDTSSTVALCLQCDVSKDAPDFCSMGLSARKRLATSIYQGLCIGSKNSAMFVTRMKVSDVPEALKQLGLNVAMGLREAFILLGESNDSTANKQKCITEEQWQEIVRRFVLAELSRRKGNISSLIQEENGEYSKAHMQLEERVLAGDVDFDAWEMVNDDIRNKPLEVVDVDVSAVEKLLQETKSSLLKRKKKKISSAKQYSLTQPPPILPPVKPFVSKSAQTIHVQKQIRSPYEGRVESKIKDIIRADKHAWQQVKLSFSFRPYSFLYIYIYIFLLLDLE